MVIIAIDYFSVISHYARLFRLSFFRIAIFAFISTDSRIADSAIFAD
jgi:hypothetical protein